MSICIIDCVYSLRAQYESTTKKFVERYANRFMNGNVNADTDQLTDFVNHIEDAGGPEIFARDVFKNMQKSGGVLKSEVCLTLERYLRYLQINTVEDFRKFECPELLEIVIRSVKGIGDACGRDFENEKIQEIFANAVRNLSVEYSGLTAAMLDGMIWRKYQIAANKSG